METRAITRLLMESTSEIVGKGHKVRKNFPLGPFLITSETADETG
jgi:hypothetical protein